MFEIQGKVALVTGGASGIGFSFTKGLLSKGLRGVTIADINEELGIEAAREFEDQFGPRKVIFVKTDVSSKEDLEEAFKRTIDAFGNLDILVNNAAINNETTPEKLIAINLTAVLHGTFLGLEKYIPKYMSGTEGVIVNVSSVGGVFPIPAMPVYTSSKFGVIGLSKAFGNEIHYQRTRIRVVALCPGATASNMAANVALHTLGEPYTDLVKKSLLHPALFRQGSEHVATALVKIIQKAKTGTVWIAENANEPYEYTFARREEFVENKLR